MSVKKKISYFYDDEIGNYVYHESHPMKPHRVRMTHHLVSIYGLHSQMELFAPKPVSEEEMLLFHTDDYIHFLKTITPEKAPEYDNELETLYGINMDCPIFDGLYRYCQLYSGGSVGGAYKLNHNDADIAINWAGGLHHAKRSAASGFCYINDIVLGILELLKFHQRVLYVDIDIHHGDGVEEAFYLTDRVMTVSFHKYDGLFFPSTGHLKDTGVGKGKGYALNFPLHDGISDESFCSTFKPIIDKVMERYRPGAIVLQCGADSLAGDRLGCFNLSTRGHGACVEHMRSYGLPLLVLGGGGYKISNVSRCWAYETAICCGTHLSEEVPMHEYYDYYAPEYLLHVATSNMEDLNSREYLERNSTHIMEVLKELPPAPSVPFHDAPRDIDRDDDALEDDQRRKDSRFGGPRLNVSPRHPSEFYADDRDQDPLLDTVGNALAGSRSAFAASSSSSSSSSTSSSSSGARLPPASRLWERSMGSTTGADKSEGEGVQMQED